MSEAESSKPHAGRWITGVVLALVSFVLCTGPMAFSSDKPELDIAMLLRVPNLAPSLTVEEVAQALTPFQDHVRKVLEEQKDNKRQIEDLAVSFAAARKVLRPRVPKVTKITFYSLLPVEASNLGKPGYKDYNAARVAELKKLPRFHEYPVLGSITIADADEANRWADFMRDQVWRGADLLCDFAPRHGFRFSTPKGDIDMLMCFTCDQLAIMGGDRLDNKNNPVFSRSVQVLINQLLDKRKIERDDPDMKGK